MAEKITFVGLEIEQFTKTKKGLTAKVKCELSAPVLEKMEWKEAPECFSGGDLEGDFAATVAELVPSDRSLAGNRIDLNVVRLNGFNIVRLEVKGKRGVGHRTELRFKLHSGDPEGAAKLENYFISSGKSQLKVSYEKQPKQPILPGTEEKDTGCPACNNEVELQPDNPKKHVNGVKCTARPVQEQLVTN